MKRREKGFTLVEVIIAIAISGMIMAALAMTTVTLLANHRRSTDQNIVLPQVQNAGCWISHDVQMAKDVIFDNPSGFPLTLDIPIDTDKNNDESVVYLFDGNKLKRQVYDLSDTLISETLIARYINVEDSTFGIQDSNIYKLTIKASKDKTVVEKSYEIVQRLGAR